MKSFISSFSGEYQRHLYRINMIAWAIILGIMLLLANSKVNTFKQNQQTIDAFKKIQESYFEVFTNYLMYQYHGFDILFVLPPTSVVANEAAISDDLLAKIDFPRTVQIYKNLKGKALASQGKGINLDIYIIIKLLISLMAIWSGFEALQNLDYLKSISSIWKHLKTFIYTIISRFLLFIMTFLLVMAIVFIFIRIRGVTFNPGDFYVIAGFLLGAVVFLAVFFLLGVLFGLLRNKKSAIFLIFISWFFINIANYWLIKPAVEPGLPDTLKEYQTVVDKWSKFVNFEALAKKEYGEFDRKNLEEARKVAEYFWTNYYPKKIAPLEEKLHDMIAGSIEKDRKISKFFPGPFFDMTANEASGRGYTNYMRFYDYSDEMQTKFVRFIIDRAYYNDPKVMVNFIQGDEDIFYGKAALPPNFWSGILIQLGYLVILIIACYFCSLRKMFPRPKDAKAFDKVSIELQSGENITLKDYTDDDNIRTQVVNTCLGESRVKDWSITLDDKPLGKEGIEGILYIPNILDIPGELKGKHVARFFKRALDLPTQKIAQLETEIGKEQLNKFFRKMEIEKQAKLILSLFFLANRRYYVTNNFPAGIPFNYFSKLENHVKDHQPEGSMIIDLHNMIIHRWMNDESQIPLHYKNGKYYAKNPLLEKDKE